MIAPSIGLAELRQAPDAAPGLVTGRHLLERHSVSPPPIGVLKRSRRYVDLIGLGEKVIELWQHEPGATPGQELVSGHRELLGRNIALARKQTLLAERFEDECTVLPAALALRL